MLPPFCGARRSILALIASLLYAVEFSSSAGKNGHVAKESSDCFYQDGENVLYTTGEVCMSVWTTIFITEQKIRAQLEGQTADMAVTRFFASIGYVRFTSAIISSNGGANWQLKDSYGNITRIGLPVQFWTNTSSAAVITSEWPRFGYIEGAATMEPAGDGRRYKVEVRMKTNTTLDAFTLTIFNAEIETEPGFWSTSNTALMVLVGVIIVALTVSSVGIVFFVYQQSKVQKVPQEMASRPRTRQSRKPKPTISENNSIVGMTSTIGPTETTEADLTNANEKSASTISLSRILDSTVNSAISSVAQKPNANERGGGGAVSPAPPISPLPATSPAPADTPNTAANAKTPQHRRAN